MACCPGARQFFEEQEFDLFDSDVYYAPGAFELPVIAQALVEDSKYDGVVCLGCVIKGETAHFEYISQATSMGLQQASLTTGAPISFGVLTTLQSRGCGQKKFAR